MSIVSCPKCADSVVMPEGASPAATVRCPLCQEEFQLSELLDAMPPALIIVEDPKAADQPAAPDSLFFADSAADRPINLLDEVETNSQPRAISIGPLETSSAPSTTPSSGKGRRVAPRPQRKKKNPAVEVAKVFFGGVAGLVIAQALLWWLPWSNYRRDPFELGPKVSEFAGWMVPEQFHGAGPAAINTDASPQPSGNDVFGPPGTELPQRTFVDPNRTQDDSQQTKTADSAGGTRAKRPKKQSGAGEELAGTALTGAHGKMGGAGDPVTLELGFHSLRNNLASAPAMDNKTGLWVVMEGLRRASEKKLNCSVSAVSTVQEEIGLRGARTSAYGIDPHVGIAVDVTHATDCPTIEKKEHVFEIERDPFTDLILQVHVKEI